MVPSFSKLSAGRRADGFDFAHHKWFYGIFGGFKTSRRSRSVFAVGSSPSCPPTGGAKCVRTNSRILHQKGNCKPAVRRQRLCRRREEVAESLRCRDKLREANQNSLTFPKWCPSAVSDLCGPSPTSVLKNFPWLPYEVPRSWCFLFLFFELSPFSKLPE